MPHDVIMKFIGKVFLLRMEINRVGSMLDSPVCNLGSSLCLCIDMLIRKSSG